MSVSLDPSTMALHTRHSIVSPPRTNLGLEDKYQVVKEIGDGSFGSVVLGRTRSAGAHVVRRNTMVAIKTMKKTFESFEQCLELREVIFLTTLPSHPHLIPTYDIFLDPFSKRLHIAMENMDGNLYQLMKAREHKQFDSASVKSIMCQILSGLEHIHAHEFFHRDIKPENILVSTSSPDNHISFKRYSNLITPPSTPPLYTVKIADFGLARETSLDSPYTTYVSTRWYRAPEVLLRAGAYSAPVDIWALGAMAVEVATLKPLFPGSNEVDQVWRVCEIMGSPGVWVNKDNEKVGGGEWKAGIKLAQKLGFSFPKMAPQSLETMLPAPQWPPEFANFVTWCLLWDPAARPTATEALAHDYIRGATDPLRPKSSRNSRLLSRKSSIIGSLDGLESPSLSLKTPSWLRRSVSGVSGKESAAPSPTAAIFDSKLMQPPPSHKNTFNEEDYSSMPPPAYSAHPAPSLPAQATKTDATAQAVLAPPFTKKVGRQLSINSTGNHYSDFHRHGDQSTGELLSPSKESFFSHLRKRARRFSGKNLDYDQTSPTTETFDKEAIDSTNGHKDTTVIDPSAAEIDKVLQSVRNSLDSSKLIGSSGGNQGLRRKQSQQLRVEESPTSTSFPGPIQLTSRTRRSTKPDISYEAPVDEKEELQDEVKTPNRHSPHRSDPTIQSSKKSHSNLPPSIDTTQKHGMVTTVPYLTPSSSKEDYRVDFDRSEYSIVGGLSQDASSPSAMPRKVSLRSGWPSTPPDEEYEWATSAAASILAAQAAYR